MENKKKGIPIEEFEFHEKKGYDFFKRIFDIVASLIMLIILSPLMLIICILVMLDGGPAIYTQMRVGKNEKQFKMYKFRSMCVGADSKENLKKLEKLNEMDGPAFKMKNDPRITKVGRILRKTSLDELPQLVNILIGNMTFVGPRPPLVTEVERYEPYQKNRLLVKQGLTCYWQCSGRNEIMFDEWVRMDLQYIMERSLWTDFKILLSTIPAVLSGKGAN